MIYNLFHKYLYCFFNTMTCLGRRANCSYESMLLCKVLKVILGLVKLVLVVATDHILNEIIFIYNQQHWYWFLLLFTIIFVQAVILYMLIYSHFPTCSVFNRYLLCNISYYQSSFWPSTEKLVKSSYRWSLTHYVPKLEPELSAI